MPACLPAAGSVKQLRQPAASVRGLHATRTTEAVEEDCSKSVVISQDEERSAGRPPAPFPRYNRTFHVDIAYMAINDPPRSLYNLRLSCEHFFDVAYNLADPFIFKQVSPSECLVNNGASINPYDGLDFEYQSESEYPFQVSTVSC